MSNEHHVPAARYYAHCFHSWLHEGEKKVRFKILLSGGVVIATTIVLIDPGWAGHSAMIGIITNLIWIWD